MNTTATDRPSGTSRGVRDVVAAGLSSGVLGGALMALVLGARALVGGSGPWAPFALFGTALVPLGSAASNAAAILLGLVVHLATSVFFGIAFAAVIGRARPSVALAGLALGVAAALVVMMLMTFGVVAVVAPALYDGISRDWPTWVAAHVAYGVGLGLEPVFRRKA